MIYVFLIVLIVALIIANILVAIAKPRKKSQTTQSFEDNYYKIESYSKENERTQEMLNTIAEKNFELEAAINANTQKINLLNERIIQLEKTISAIIQNQLNGKETNKEINSMQEQENLKLKALAFNNRKKYK